MEHVVVRVKEGTGATGPAGDGRVKLFSAVGSNISEREEDSA